MKIENIIPLILVSAVLAMLGFSAYREHNNPIVCKETKTVDKILAVKYREAAIQMTDGTVMIVNQETLQPGDKFCVKRGRKND